MIFKKNFLLFIATLLAFNVMMTSKSFAQAVECAVFSNDTKGNLRLCEIGAELIPNGGSNPFVITDERQRLLLAKEISPTIGGIIYYEDYVDRFGKMLLVTMFRGHSYTDSATGELINIDSRGNEVGASKITVDTSMMYAQNENPLTAYDARSFYIAEKKVDSWIQYSQTSAKKKESSSSTGFKLKSKVIAMGLNSEISKDLVVGGSISLSESDIRRVGVTNENDSNRYTININAVKKLGDKYYAQGSVGFTHKENSAIRVQTQNNNAIVTSDSNGQTYSAGIGGGMKNKINDFIITPELNLNYANSHNEKFQEEGAGIFALIVDSQDTEFLETEIAASASYKGFKKDVNVIIPRIRLGYGYDLIGEDSITNFSFVGAPGQVIRVTNAKANRSTFTTLAAIDIYNKKGFALKLNYLNTKRDDFTAHTGSFSFNYQF